MRLASLVAALLLAVTPVAQAWVLNETQPQGNATAQSDVAVRALPTTANSTAATGTNGVAAPADAPQGYGAERQDKIPNVPGEAGKTLLILFLMAVLLENALAPLFGWRVFQAYFSGRGAKMPITLIASGILVATTTPDTIVRLYAAYGQAIPATESLFILRVLEAMVIAGGSAGVYRLMVALGFRSSQDRVEDAVRPRPSQGWISIALLRRNAVGPVQVMLEENGAGFQLIGTITGGRPGAAARPKSPYRLILRNDDRYPLSGGLPVEGATEIKVKLTAVDQSNKPVSEEWGPFRIRAGAIIDVDVAL